MADSFGIDTQTTHLDLIQWPPFQAWNQGLVPAFAGRNFLGGDFIWAPAEATTALTAPSPEDFSKLALLTPLIAPMQGVMTARQQVVGSLGTLYGQIDADALCARLSAAMGNKELTAKTSNLVNVYLQVDPSVPFSADYWAGWADQVFNAPFTVTDPDGSSVTTQPYLPCIMCRFSLAGTVLQIDPHVTTALQAAHDQHSELRTQCFGFWADAPDLDPALQRPNPQIDWARFAPTPAPIWLWRFARTLQAADGSAVFAAAPLFATSAINAVGTPTRFGWEFMLDTWEWQPSPAGLRYAFITDQEDGITAAQVTRIKRTPLPAMQDLEPHYHFPGGPVAAIGRYLKPTVQNAAHVAGHFVLQRAEALSLSAAEFDLFTIWEDINALVHGQPTDRIGIQYFDPAFHAGTEDGQKAFAFCGGTLRQPPYSCVFFTVDFDPEDPAFLHGISVADAKTRLLAYFGLVKAQRDAYALSHPGRYYLIGVYGKASVLEWCYRDPASAVSVYWQSGSSGTSNRVPRRPWCHAHRWQIADQSQLDPTWGIVRGADPDVDWGDGGTWRLDRPLARQLEQAEDAAQAAVQQLLQHWFPLLYDL